MLNYLVDFFETTGFAPHGFCLDWQPGVFWSHVGADLIIAFSYFSIPSVLAVFAFQRGLKHGNWVLLLFVAFIVACGVTHLASIWVMWDPQYGVEAIIKVITAIVSFSTAIVLWFLLPIALRVPTPQELANANAELEREVRKRQEAQQALETLNNELEERVRQRTAELESANRTMKEEIQRREKAEAAMRDAIKRAEDANNAKSSFLAAMSHEIRTPLNAIVGFSEVLEMQHMGSLNAKAAEYIRYIRESGQSLANLMKDILDLTRIENGQIPISISNAQVEDIIEPVVAQIQNICAAKRLHFRLKNDLPDGLVFRTDPTRVQQVIGNFLSNAVKYNRDSGLIELRIRQEAGNIVFEVEDTGPGIPEKDLDRIFIPFDRLNADETTIEGTGIGLAICRRLADALNGMIQVRSTVGQGSTFALALPAHAG